MCVMEGQPPLHAIIRPADRLTGGTPCRTALPCTPLPPLVGSGADLRFPGLRMAGERLPAVVEYDMRQEAIALGHQFGLLTWAQGRG